MEKTITRRGRRIDNLSSYLDEIEDAYGHKSEVTSVSIRPVQLGEFLDHEVTITFIPEVPDSD